MSVNFLEQQIRWSIAGTDKRCRLDVLYDALCGFRDFRRLEVVWSGNKSCHPHTSSIAGISLVAALSAISKFHRVRTPRSRTASCFVRG
jgi:hypothetical protein